MTRRVEVRAGAYRDSVGLMQVSSRLRSLPRVTSALVAMATELNVDLLVSMGFQRPAGVSPHDMVVAVAAEDDDALASALVELEAALAAKPTGDGPGGQSVPPPQTVGAAARRSPARLALVSTPGHLAAIDAADALAAGLDVMVFSDNVPVQHEVALKELAAGSGLLVMGPDCGTAVVDGVGLGFANVVRPGPVGIVAASGTGAQQLMALLDGAGVGVTHCLGVGGRDLSSDVAGRSTLAALDRLDADDTVTTIVVVSKPPAVGVADAITAHAERLETPTVLGYLGPGRPDLTATAQRVVEAVGLTWTPPRRWVPPTQPRPRGGDVRGLYAGGTLCDEAMLIATPVLGPVASNIALADGRPVDDSLAPQGHTFIDFGDDRLTQGRPHPMIDPSMRLERLAAELADPSCAVVLVDVVLGHGAHPDPATDLAALISAADTPVVVTLVGTRDDPQGLDSQAAVLAGAGAVVHASNAAAVRAALGLVDAARTGASTS